MLTIVLNIAAFILGIVVSNILFYNDLKKVTINNFFNSERLLGFILQILIAFLGFGVTLYVSNLNEVKNEEKYVLQMLEQASAYTQNRLDSSEEFMESYQNNGISWKEFYYSDKMAFDYYDNLLSNDLVMNYIDMNAYGYVLQYLSWAKDIEVIAMEEEDESKAYDYFAKRDEHIKKMDKILQGCCEKLKGNLNDEELMNYVREVKKNSNYTLETKKK